MRKELDRVFPGNEDLTPTFPPKSGRQRDPLDVTTRFAPLLAWLLRSWCSPHLADRARPSVILCPVGARMAISVQISCFSGVGKLVSMVTQPSVVLF
jgi:hypothetical protein